MSLLKWSVSLFLLLAALPVANRAQPLRGLPSAGMDFYIGYSPGLKQANTFVGAREVAYLLIGSLQDNNLVNIYFFDSTNGLEYRAANFTLIRGAAREVPLDLTYATPTKPGEVAEYRAVHIVSQYPITVQVYQEGSSTGGLYSAIPTPALSTKYVIASYKSYAGTKRSGWITLDSSSSWFMLVAAYDSTRVTYVPTATTYGGTTGMNSGPGHDGKAHPVTKLLRRGQIWHVRSYPSDDGDLSGTTVSSDKPIAVLAGQERAMLGDPTSVWTTLDNDIRDVLVEQMTPVHAWGVDYPSIPFDPPAPAPRLLVDGKGDMYRLFADSATNLVSFDSTGAPITLALNRYQYPVREFYSVEKSVDISSQYGRPFYALIYDKFQGAHDFDPGGMSTEKGGKSPLDELTYTTPSEMNLIPLDHFVTSTVFMVPANSNYRGNQYFNIICNKDSLDKITVKYNGHQPKLLSSYTPVHRYAIPNHPELAGLTIQVQSGTYLLSGHTPFACYSYGRTEGLYKDGWGYAAPAGQSYADRSDTTKPGITVVGECDDWHIHISDSLPTDRGIAYAVLLNDRDSLYNDLPALTQNMDLTGTFDAGAKSVDVSLRVIDGSRPAVASLYIEDIGGHDTLLRFAYDPPFLSSVSSISYSLFGKDTCKTVFVRNPLQVPTTLTTLSISGDSTFYISNAPLLPATIAAGDSLPVTICFGAGDTSHHTSLFTAQSLCGSISLALQGRRTNGPLAVFNRLQRNTDVSFELIPNPARSNVVAHVMSGSPGELEIYSILGARISETEIAPGVRDIPLSLQSLPRGTYIVRLTTDTGTISRRLEIQ